MDQPDKRTLRSDTILDLRRRELELAQERLCSVARVVAERHPQMALLVSAVGALDAALHRLYEEEEAIT
jgi:hypothetical protein